MFKMLQFPIRAIIALALLLSVGSASQAAYNTDLYDATLKKIYRNPGDGDWDDIYKIIKHVLEANPAEGSDFVDAIVSALKHNRSKLSEDISTKDLNRVLKTLHGWLDSNRPGGGGTITPPTSAH